MRTPLSVVLILLVFSILTDWLIWSDIRRQSKRKFYARAYLYSSIFCWITLFVTILFPKKDAAKDILPLMWILYYYVAIYLGKFFTALCILIGRIPLLIKKRSLNLGKWIGIPLFLVTLFGAIWGASVTRHQVNIESITISSPRLPKEFDGYRITQFSDIHLGTWGNDTSFVSKVVDSINSTNPNLIVFTGDIVNRKTSELIPFINILSGLKATDGVVSILGNHDYGDYIAWESPQDKANNLNELIVLQHKMGWKLLNNDFITLKKGAAQIQVIGVENWGEPPFKVYGDLRKSYPTDSIHNLKDGYYKILLSHNPEHWNQEVTEISNIDLTLSGHTHAMQFMLRLGDWKWSPAKYRYPQWGGAYNRSDKKGNISNLYVNIGTGEVGIPTRIGATPEITVITLKSKSSTKNSTETK